jgi:hypothetical protein
MVSSIPYRLIGMNGLYLLPFISSLLTLLGVARIVSTALARRSSGDGGPLGKSDLEETRPPPVPAGGSGPLVVVSILGAGFLTPLWFYSAVFWEHAIAVCLCIWAVYFHLSFLKRRNLLDLAIGSALCAIAIWFRDELYLFMLVLVLNQLRALRREGWRTAIRVIAVSGVASVIFLLPSGSSTGGRSADHSISPGDAHAKTTGFGCFFHETGLVYCCRIARSAIISTVLAALFCWP